MEENLQQIEKELEIIKQRNLRVEADKAWETSMFRVCSLCGITYIIASAVLYLIGVENFLLSALVPTVGYYLSTQSLPVIKSAWLKRHQL